MGSYEPTSHDHSKDVLYTIKKSDYVGRYMVAARDIKPGEPIFSDQPACIGKIAYNSGKPFLAQSVLTILFSIKKS